MSLDKPICKSVTTRAPIRQQRIERWVQKEKSLSQTDRFLNVKLLQLGDQREKLIERHNYTQKLFVNKQAMRHKDNDSILSTLNYVRKCCRYFDMSNVDEDSIDPAKWLEENSTTKMTRARSPNAHTSQVKRAASLQASKRSTGSVAEVFLQHNKKHIQSSRNASAKKTVGAQSSTIPPNHYDDNDDAGRHVQFQVNPERSIQSAHAFRKANNPSFPADDKQTRRNVTSAHGLRTYQIAPTDSTPVLTTVDQMEEQTRPVIRTRRSPTRTIATKSSLREFRQHPERFLSKSNRYLPLLQRQASQIESQSKQQKPKASSSPLVDGSDLAYDDARSFLSEEVETRKFVRSPLPIPVFDNHADRAKQKLRAPTKIDLMATTIVETSEQTAALFRLRNREYARLQNITQTNSIEHILESLSPMTTSDNPAHPPRCLKDILRSVDSLRCSTTLANHKRRQSEIDRNLSKLGILIF